MHNLTIWTALRNARKERGWTIEKAAEQVGVDVSSYHRWELQRFAEVLTLKEDREPQSLRQIGRSIFPRTAIGQHRPYSTNTRRLVEALQTNYQGEMICLYGTPLTVSIQRLALGLVREGIDYRNVQILIRPGRCSVPSLLLQCRGRVDRSRLNTHKGQMNSH
jgi:transcriptional regulator with XRE-family HTH domain